MTKVTS
jgi:hypothetical protein